MLRMFFAPWTGGCLEASVTEYAGDAGAASLALRASVYGKGSTGAFPIATECHILATFDLKGPMKCVRLPACGGNGVPAGIND